jgi:hypothetical protein
MTEVIQTDLAPVTPGVVIEGETLLRALTFEGGGPQEVWMEALWEDLHIHYGHQEEPYLTGHYQADFYFL